MLSLLNKSHIHTPNKNHLVPHYNSVCRLCMLHCASKGLIFPHSIDMKRLLHLKQCEYSDHIQGNSPSCSVIISRRCSKTILIFFFFFSPLTLQIQQGKIRDKKGNLNTFVFAIYYSSDAGMKLIESFINKNVPRLKE